MALQIPSFSPLLGETKEEIEKNNILVYQLEPKRIEKKVVAYICT